MQDAVRWYVAASTLALEAGLARLQRAVALYPAYALAWIKLGEAPHRAGCLRRRLGSSRRTILRRSHKACAQSQSMGAEQPPHVSQSASEIAFDLASERLSSRIATL